MKLFYLFTFAMVFATQILSQNQRFIHQTFPLDTATTLQLDLYGEYKTEFWEGDAVMVETQVSIFNIQQGAFNQYIKDGRYQVEAKLTGTTLLITAKQKDRPPLKKESNEQALVKVFLPDTLQAAGTNTWKKETKSE